MSKCSFPAPSEGVYSEQLTVSEADCDPSGRLRPGALLRLMQDAGSAHAELLGIGRQRIREAGAAWIIVRTGLEAERLPSAGERCTLLTFPGVTRKVFMPRYFELYGEDGALLVRSCSEYMLMDPRQRKMLFPQRLGIGIEAALRTAPIGEPPLRVPFPGELPREERRTVRYSELDSNGHLNNTRYIDWAEDLLSAEFHRTRVLRSLWAEYSAEILPDTTLTLRYDLSDNTLCLRGEGDGARHFSLRAAYRESL